MLGATAPAFTLYALQVSAGGAGVGAAQNGAVAPRVGAAPAQGGSARVEYNKDEYYNRCKAVLKEPGPRATTGARPTPCIPCPARRLSSRCRAATTSSSSPARIARATR
ncbi:hypothetical protein MGG_13087 [Pyricularia oryzae 70-15]|uniref:Uncharacterized protein n=1 Tax=Pyricularia oryzae (strain 70-15 / ATCC MYA-4617 / FGSC 8958) TaxID=242507 RepID=G4MM68_PYRO7|nr:uncharacterized protein MGG_13087 [Pyricularia oryzae 70-15]EHA57749.1 hypothetical protein MGG_13087 [Pyricularia oryzae 70-15]